MILQFPTLNNGKTSGHNSLFSKGLVNWLVNNGKSVVLNINVICKFVRHESYTTWTILTFWELLRSLVGPTGTWKLGGLVNINLTL